MAKKRFKLLDDFFHSDDGRHYKAGAILALDSSDEHDKSLIANKNLFQEIGVKKAAVIEDEEETEDETVHELPSKESSATEKTSGKKSSKAKAKDVF